MSHVACSPKKKPQPLNNLKFLRLFFEVILKNNLEVISENNLKNIGNLSEILEVSNMINIK